MATKKKRNKGDRRSIIMMKHIKKQQKSQTSGKWEFPFQHLETKVDLEKSINVMK